MANEMLKAMAVPGCWAKFLTEQRVWSFPCGLSVTPEYAKSRPCCPGYYTAYQEQHLKRHQDRGHPENTWSFSERSEAPERNGVVTRHTVGVIYFQGEGFEHAAFPPTTWLP